MKGGNQPIKRGYFNANTVNTAYLESLPDKFQSERHEFRMEEFLDCLTPRNHIKRAAILKFIQVQKEKMAQAGKTHEAAAWAHWESEILLRNFEKKEDKEFVTDFQKWLLGKGNLLDHQRTPWYMRRCYDKECEYYLSSMLDAKYGFLRELNKLLLKGKMGALRGIKDYYMYFKYIVRGEWDNVEAADFMHDWGTLINNVNYLEPRQHGILSAGKLRPSDDDEPLIPIEEIDGGKLKETAMQGIHRTGGGIEYQEPMNLGEDVGTKKQEAPPPPTHKDLMDNLPPALKETLEKSAQVTQTPDTEMEEEEAPDTEMEEEENNNTMDEKDEDDEEMKDDKVEAPPEAKIVNVPEEKPADTVTNPQTELLVEQRKTNDLLAKLLERYQQKDSLRNPKPTTTEIPEETQNPPPPPKEEIPEEAQNPPPPPKEEIPETNEEENKSGSKRKREELDIPGESEEPAPKVLLQPRGDEHLIDWDKVQGPVSPPPPQEEKMEDDSSQKQEENEVDEDQKWEEAIREKRAELEQDHPDDPRAVKRELNAWKRENMPSGVKRKKETIRKDPGAKKPKKPKNQ